MVSPTMPQSTAQTAEKSWKIPAEKRALPSAGRAVKGFASLPFRVFQKTLHAEYFRLSRWPSSFVARTASARPSYLSPSRRERNLVYLYRLPSHLSFLATAPVSRFHSTTSFPAEAENRLRPSEENATEVTLGRPSPCGVGTSDTAGTRDENKQKRLNKEV